MRSLYTVNRTLPKITTLEPYSPRRGTANTAAMASADAAAFEFGYEDFDNIINFRDVGKTVNEYLSQRLVREGLLFRSARPDDATPRDRYLLKHVFGIKTVIDLRTK